MTSKAFYVSGNLMVETGHFPSCPLIKIGKPCNSSSQTFSTVPALPLVRATDLPISRERASSYALRIVAAWGTSGYDYDFDDLASAAIRELDPDNGPRR